MSDGSEDEDGVGKNFENVHIKTLSVDNIDIPGTDTNDVGTIKLADNLEIAGDGLILHDLEDYDFSTANIDLDNTDDNNDNIVTYSDDNTTTTVTEVNSDRIITVADSTKSSTSEQNITINGRPYTIIQSGTTITLVDTLKKIISLEAGNLVIATYKSDGTRIDKEIIMDTNNSISEIANGSFDLKVRSLDVTNTTSINETTPSEGCVRIDNFIINTPQTITVGGSGITATETDPSYTTEPTNSIVYLKATPDTSPVVVTYVWTLDNFTPNEGQMFTIFFNNSADTNVHLKITFGTDGLVTGNGLNDALTFTIHGQSASLVYIDTKWCIINTGAAVS